MAPGPRPTAVAAKAPANAKKMSFKVAFYVNFTSPFTNLYPASSLALYSFCVIRIAIAVKTMAPTKMILKNTKSSPSHLLTPIIDGLPAGPLNFMQITMINIIPKFKESFVHWKFVLSFLMILSSSML